MKYIKINTFCSMEFFLQLNIILPIVYNNNSTWLIFAPNINQSTFWIVLDGLIWTSAVIMLDQRLKLMVGT